MNMNKVMKPVGKEGRDRSDDKENLYDREQVVERNSSSLKMLKQKVEGQSRWWRATRAADTAVQPDCPMRVWDQSPKFPGPGNTPVDGHASGIVMLYHTLSVFSGWIEK
ncbi:hypothetical protein AMECASPLE_016684 [Ameca splendens]|uniref:Uncharacterized protein n=1 Tax=Ameca splendens TaxID=208324 RepID=A0ABV0ZY23_9TELE